MDRYLVSVSGAGELICFEERKDMRAFASLYIQYP